MSEPSPPATSTQLNSVMSGDNTTGHVVTVSILGDALASIATWGLQLAHIPPPADVQAAFSVVLTVLASLILQRSSQ